MNGYTNAAIPTGERRYKLNHHFSISRHLIHLMLPVFATSLLKQFSLPVAKTGVKVHRGTMTVADKTIEAAASIQAFCSGICITN